ncbi:hypothetical protein [Roseicyclus sp.]
MSESYRNADLTRLIEALVVTPKAGQAVARALIEKGEDRATRQLVAEMRARRAETARQREMDRADAGRMKGAESDAAPSRSLWAQSQ